MKIKKVLQITLVLLLLVTLLGADKVEAHGQCINNKEDIPHAEMGYIESDEISLLPEYQYLLFKCCEEYDVDYYVALALCCSESSFNEDAISADGRDFGLFQIRDVNFKRLKRTYNLDPLDYYDNIECGVIMVHELREKYPDYSYEQILTLYKCGEGAGHKLIAEGRVLGAAKSVVANASNYEELICD